MLSEVISEDIEIRKLKQFVVHGLSRILNERDGWKKLMSLVTEDCDPQKPLKYSMQDIKAIETAGKNTERGCTAVFLDEWGTSGRRRPKLNDLLKFLELAELHRACYYINKDVLKKIEDTVETVDDKWIEEVIVHEERKCQLENRPGELIRFNFCELEGVTCGFNDKPRRENGNQLGKGEFSTVYYGKLKNGKEIAVKKIEANCSLSSTQDTETPKKLYENELNMAKCKHDNLLRLIGYSDSFINCIVYEFMCNGSLLDRLACLDDTQPLSAVTRCSIALGVAEALHYLHFSLDKPIIHRDVKSANVLLDAHFVPKLGDFGIVKKINANATSTVYTENNSGTSPYMPHEAHHGDVSVKTDVFSFGVVVLELLTGMKPFDEERKTTLYYYLVVDEVVPVREVLDKKAGEWKERHVDVLVKVAQERCCKHEKHNRADMRELVDLLRPLIEE